MKNRFLGKAENYRINSFVLILLTIFLTNIVLTIVFYNEFEDISLDRIYNYSDSNLTQVGMHMDQIEESVKLTAMQVYYSQYVQKFTLNAPLTDEELRFGLSELGMMRYLTNYIDSIYIYNNHAQMFYISGENATYLLQNKNEFFDKDILKILEEYQYHKPFVPIPRQIPIDTPSTKYNESYNGYTFLLYDTFEGKLSNSAVIINVKEDKLLKYIKKIDSTEKSKILLIDPSGTQSISNGKTLFLDDLSKEKYVSRIINSGNTKGWFIDQVDGIKSFIAYSLPDNNGWRYISITPYSEVTRQINDLRNKSLIVSMIFLIMGALLAFLASRSLYNPIKKMLSRINLLESEKLDSQDVIRNNTLRNIIKDYNCLNINAVKNVLGDNSLFLNEECKIVLILLKIDKYKDFCDKYNINDRSLMKFAIMNITNELFSEEYQTEVIDMGEDQMCVILFINNQDFSSACSAFNTLCSNIQDCVLKYLEISISLVISTIGSSLQHITQMYNQVLEGSFHKLFYGNKCIIYMEDINKYIEEDYEYPQHREKMLIDALMLGNIREAKKLYLEIIEYFSKFPYTTINMALSCFVYKLKISINNIIKTNFPDTPINLNMAVSLNQFETIDDFNNHFIKAFENLNLMLARRKDTQNNVMVDKIVDIINTEYSNLELSLEYIADRLGYNPSYLGRLFKGITNKTIPVMIMDCRIQKAKELLLNTNMSITQISLKTGFSNDGYFYKAFKKINGITPNNYRENFGDEKG